MARWVHDRYSDPVHFGVEVLLYGTAGPLLAFWVRTLVSRWLNEKEHAEKSARASERRLAAITAASGDAILGLDSAGHIESWNHGAELLFGYPADEMRGRPLCKLFGGGEAAEVEFRWLAETVRQTAFVRGHETDCREAEGREITVELTATHLTAEAGQAIGMSIILRDVTDRKRREQEIRWLNRNDRRPAPRPTAVNVLTSPDKWQIGTTIEGIQHRRAKANQSNQPVPAAMVNDPHEGYWAVCVA